jgi:hypothetical protein
LVTNPATTTGPAMVISLECPGCGKCYELREELAGKRVKCGCGRVVRVPAEATEPPQELLLDEERPRAAAPGPSQESPAAAASPSPAAMLARRRRKREGPRQRRWRIAVGILSIIYGIGMVPLSFLTSAVVPTPITSFITREVLAVAIAVGGVLILRRHKSGPACAGLSCIFLCFFQIVFLFGGFLSALADAEWRLALFIPLYLLAVYSIPVIVTVWCLKQEAARARREADNEPL